MPFRVATAIAKRTYPFSPNGRFEMLSSTWTDVDTGDLGLCYGLDHTPAKYVHVDYTYRTVFGPLFSHTAHVYACTDENMSHAFTRLTNCKDGNPNFHEQLRQAQFNFVTSPELRRYADLLYRKYDTLMMDEDVDYRRLCYIYAIHPKRAERVAAYIRASEDGTWFSRPRTIKVKFKKDEFAKPGKNPRAIADLGTLACIRAGSFAEKVKKAMAKIFSDDVFYASASSTSVLHECFRRLVHDDFFFCFSSDDSSIGCQLADGRLIANMDISSCDGSHTGELFSWMRRTVPHRYRSEFDEAISQLTGILTLESVQKPKDKHSTKYRVTEPTLFSGSVLTTLTNNYANVLIAYAIKRYLAENPYCTIKQFVDAIPGITRSTGYVVTIDVCRTPADLQFLKHSPNRDLMPCLNLGVILRAMGQCKGDIPLKKKNKKEGVVERGQRFGASVLKGMEPTGKSSIFFALKRKLGDAESTPHGFREYATADSSGNYCFDDVDIMDRYQCSSSDINDLVELIRKSPTNVIIRTPLTDSILNKDYGYAPSLEDTYLQPGDDCTISGEEWLRVASLRERERDETTIGTPIQANRLT